jgi:hypothetical protein
MLSMVVISRGKGLKMSVRSMALLFMDFLKLGEFKVWLLTIEILGASASAGIEW